jgi:hypothetical protein
VDNQNLGASPAPEAAEERPKRKRMGKEKTTLTCSIAIDDKRWIISHHKTYAEFIREKVNEEREKTGKNPNEKEPTELVVKKTESGYAVSEGEKEFRVIVGLGQNFCQCDEYKSRQTCKHIEKVLGEINPK